MAIKPYMRLILIVAIAFLSVLPATLCIEDKCAACTTIAVSIHILFCSFHANAYRCILPYFVHMI